MEMKPLAGRLVVLMLYAVAPAMGARRWRIGQRRNSLRFARDRSAPEHRGGGPTKPPGVLARA
jgi:hypothetical protein